MPVRVPTLSSIPFPEAPYLSRQGSIDLLVKFLKRGNGKTVVLTGAGVSVDSGIRAYRGKHGSYTVNKKHRPIFFGEFVAEEANRRRYWARSFLGYPPVRIAEPNPTHYSISALMKMGFVSKLITQNVDGLHHRSWDSDLSAYLAPLPSTTPPSASDPPPSPILELHGTLRHAACIKCHNSIGRDAFQDRLSLLNPEWARYVDEILDGKHDNEERLNPDGDVELGPGIKYEEFIVPECESCGGPMKPKVTFFGESLEPHVRDLSAKWIDQCSQLLVVGSSLATFSAFRLIRQAKEKGLEVGLLNVGESRADPLVDWRIGHLGGAGEIVPDAGRILWEELRKSRIDVGGEVNRMLHSGVVKEVRGGTTS